LRKPITGFSQPLYCIDFALIALAPSRVGGVRAAHTPLRLTIAAMPAQVCALRAYGIQGLASSSATFCILFLSHPVTGCDAALAALMGAFPKPPHRGAHGGRFVSCRGRYYRLSGAPISARRAVVYSAFLLLAFSIDVVDLINRTAGRGVPSAVIVGMALLQLPDLGQKLLPFAVLLGGVFCFVRLSRSQELVATRAAGVSAWTFSSLRWRLPSGSV